MRPRWSSSSGMPCRWSRTSPVRWRGTPSSATTAITASSTCSRTTVPASRISPVTCRADWHVISTACWAACPTCTCWRSSPNAVVKCVADAALARLCRCCAGGNAHQTAMHRLAMVGDQYHAAEAKVLGEAGEMAVDADHQRMQFRIVAVELARGRRHVQVAAEVDERLQPPDLVEELREDDALVDVAAQRDELVLGRIPDRRLERRMDQLRTLLVLQRSHDAL